MRRLFTVACVIPLLLSACQEAPIQPVAQALPAVTQNALLNKSFRWQVLIQPPKVQGRTPLKPELLTSFRIGNLQIPVAQIQRLDLLASRANTPPESQPTNAPIGVQYKGNGQYVIQFKQAPPKPWIVQMQIQGYDQPASFPWVEAQGDQLFTIQISRNPLGQTQVKGFYPQLAQSVRSFTVEPQPDNQQDLVWQQADGSSKRMDFDQILQASQNTAGTDSNDPAQTDSAWPSSFDENWNQSDTTSGSTSTDKSFDDPWGEVNQLFGQLEGRSPTDSTSSENPGWEDSGFQNFPTGNSSDTDSSDSSGDTASSSSDSADSSSGSSSDSSSGGSSGGDA